MKIVHVCTTAPWDEKYAYQENLLPHYHRLMGHEVTILAPVYSTIGYDKDGIKSDGVRVLSDGSRLVRLKPLIKRIRLDAHLHLVKGLKAAILKEKPNLLFIHDVCSYNYLCLVAIKKLMPNTIIVADNHSDLINSLHSPLTKILHRIIYRYTLIPRMLKVVEWFYGVTPSRCTFLHDIYGIPYDKIKLLIMGADNEVMCTDKRDEMRKSIRDKYNVRESDFLIVTGGKIDRRKNVHALVDAVNSLGRPNVKLLIFGTITEDMQSLFKSKLSPNIITTGWIASDKVYGFFYAADLVVFPGLHSVLWEQAVASKVPCAFSKIEGFEHIQVDENCILMEDNSSDYYKLMIENLLQNPEKYSCLKMHSESKAIEKFYYTNIAQQVFDDVGF